VDDGKAAELNALQLRYRNALLWIRMIAGLHYFGGAFNPEHMRALANLAADALDGKDLPDFGARMAEGKRRAGEMADALGIELLGGDDENDEKGDAGGTA
jgi:hypothetical protein